MKWQIRYSHHLWQIFTIISSLISKEYNTKWVSSFSSRYCKETWWRSRSLAILRRRGRATDLKGGSIEIRQCYKFRGVDGNASSSFHLESSLPFFPTPPLFRHSTEGEGGHICLRSTGPRPWRYNKYPRKMYTNGWLMRRYFRKDDPLRTQDATRDMFLILITRGETNILKDFGATKEELFNVETAERWRQCNISKRVTEREVDRCMIILWYCIESQRIHLWLKWAGFKNQCLTIAYNNVV